MAEERVVYSDGKLPPPSPGTICTAEEGKTVQSDRDASDINLVIKKYNLQPLGLAPGWSGRIGEYGDFSEVPTFQEAMNKVVAARELFEQLDPILRQELGGPAGMLDKFDAAMAGDEREVERFIELGLLERVDDPPVAPGPTA